MGSRVIYVVYAANTVIGLLIGLVTLTWMTRYLALPVKNSAVIAAILLLGGGTGRRAGAVVVAGRLPDRAVVDG